VSMASGEGRYPMGFLPLFLVLCSLKDPFEHAAVVAIAGPQPLAIVAFPEPVDIENFRQLFRRGLLAYFYPVRKVIPM